MELFRQPLLPPSPLLHRPFRDLQAEHGLHELLLQPIDWRPHALHILPHPSRLARVRALADVAIDVVAPEPADVLAVDVDPCLHLTLEVVDEPRTLEHHELLVAPHLEARVEDDAVPGAVLATAHAVLVTSS